MKSDINAEKNGRTSQDDIIRCQKQRDSRVNKRQRGTHSTHCLNPKPLYIRPQSWKNLPGELGKTYNFCRTRDISRDPHFVYLRKVVGRQRDFKQVRRDLINPFFQLCLSRHDLVTGIIELDLESMAIELSNMWLMDAETGESYLAQCKVTISRISRFIEEVMIPFGFIYVHADRDQYSTKNGMVWDKTNGFWYPKVMVLTEAFYRLAGANLEKLHIQRQAQLAFRNAGIAAASELITIKEARVRKQKQIFKRAWHARKHNASARRRRNKLLKMSVDERKYAVAISLTQSMPACELAKLDSKAFTQLVWARLYSMDLANPLPPTAPT